MFAVKVEPDLVESPHPESLVLGVLRQQHSKTDMADKKGQQYLKTVAEYKPLPLDLIHFCAFKNIFQSSSGCCLKALYSSYDVDVERKRGVCKETFQVV